VLRRIEERWRALAVAQGNADVSPDAFWALLDYWDGAGEPFVPVVRDAAGSVVGLLPLVRSSGRRGDLHYGPKMLSLKPQVVAPRGLEAAVGLEAAGALRRERRNWSSMRLSRIPDSAPWLGPLASLGRGRIAEQRTITGTEVGVEIAGRTWQAFLASKGSHFRERVGAPLRSLRRAHEVHFRLSEAAGDVEDETNVLLDMHLARWDVRTGDSIFEIPSVRRFYHRFAVSASHHGWLRLWFMEIDGEQVAGNLCLHVGGRTCGYIAGFEPKWSKASAGMLLLSRAIEGAFEEGADSFDLGSGHHAYKRRFADTETAVVELLCARRLGPVHLRAGGERLARRLLVPARRALRRNPPARRR
jgi:CelD/BcsL family acetyltransferase involved in cellulose biosynthesis